MEGGGASSMEKAVGVAVVVDLEGEKAEVEKAVAVDCAGVGVEEVVDQANLVEGVVDQEEARLDGGMQAVKTAVEVAAAKPGGEEAVGKAAVAEQPVGEKEVGELAVGEKRVREEDVTEIAVAEQEADSSTSHANKKMKVVVVEVPFAVADVGSPESFNSGSSDEPVESWNVASFIEKEVKLLQKEAPRNYVRGARYRCPYHARKPKCCSLKGLLAHARDVAHHFSGEVREKAEHKALLEVLRQAGLA